MNTHRLNHKSYLSLSGTHLNYYEITGRDTATKVDTAEKFSEWKENTLDVGDFKVIPYGTKNDIPQQIQSTVLANGFATRALNRKVELLVEQGPYIYKMTKDGTKYFREPMEDDAITNWFEAFNGEELLHNNARDTFYQGCYFNKIYRSRSGRLQQPAEAANIEFVPGTDCRLAYRRNDKKEIPTHVIVGDWVKQDAKNFKAYPLFDPKKPDKYPVSIHYVKCASYGMSDYPLPDIYGSLDWIKNTTKTPKIFKAFTENSLNIKWHIQSPSAFWDAKRKAIQNNLKAESPPKPYKEQMLEDLKTEILDSLSTLLSGVENVGKFWHNEYVVNLIGANAVEQGWKITPIEQKTKEWVESQIKMYTTAIFAMQAGVGVHASLLMVGADGKSDSGSEQLNAFIVHQKTATPMPEYYVCKSVNDLLKPKFGNQQKIGFYRTTPERQQDITKSQRFNAAVLPAETSEE